MYPHRATSDKNVTALTDDDDDCVFDQLNQTTTAFGVVIDYRARCLLELVASPDISIRWKLSAVKYLFTNRLQKGYVKLATALDAIDNADLFVRNNDNNDNNRASPLLILPPSSVKFNNMKNMVEDPCAVQNVVFESRPWSRAELVSGVPLELVHHPKWMCQCKARGCYTESMNDHHWKTLTDKKLATFFDSFQTQPPTFSNKRDMLTAFVKPFSWKWAKDDTLGNVWHLIPSDFLAWEDMVFSAKDKRAQEASLPFNCANRTVNCLAFTPVKNEEKRRLFQTTELLDFHISAAAVLPNTFDQMAFWENGELKQSVVEKANLARQFLIQR